MAQKFDIDKYYIQNFKNENGLSQCVVTSIVQDSKGFLWFGTLDGLNKFDGYNFKIYRHNPEESSTIPSSKINSVFADSNNHLIVNTTGGTCFFDCATGKRIFNKKLQKINLEIVENYTKDSVLIYTKNKGLTLLNTKNWEAEELQAKDNSIYKDLLVISLLKWLNKVYIIGSNGDIVLYNKQSKKYLKYITTTKFKEVVTQATFDKNNHILLYNKSAEITSFDTELLTFYNPEYLAKQQIKNCIKIQYSKRLDVLLIVTYENGLYVYDYVTGLLTHV
jgi:hypothetical protein